MVSLVSETRTRRALALSCREQALNAADALAEDECHQHSVLMAQMYREHGQSCMSPDFKSSTYSNHLQFIAERHYRQAAAPLIFPPVGHHSTITC